MKKLLVALLALWACAAVAQQTYLLDPKIQKGVIYSDPLYSTLGQQDAMNTYLFAHTGGGGSFGTLTGGTNTSAAMLVGSGSTFGPTGTGVISANQINGAAVPFLASVIGTNSTGQIIAMSTTGTGNNVLATSPSITTPTITSPTFTGASTGGSGAIALSDLAQIATNCVLGNFSGINASPSCQSSILISSVSTGGVLYGINATTVGSSNTLTAAQPVCGGGAGTAPLPCTLSQLVSFGIGALGTASTWTAEQTFSTSSTTQALQCTTSSTGYCAVFTSGTSAPVEFINNYSSGSTGVFNALAPSLATSSNLSFGLGVQAGNYQEAQYEFYYTSANNSQNAACLNMYGGGAFCWNGAYHYYFGVSGGATSGPAPSITTSGGTCGTSDALDGFATDAAGTLTTGTGTVSSCVITFNKAYVNFDHVRVTAHSSSTSFSYTYSKSAITITTTAASAVFEYTSEGS